MGSIPIYTKNCQSYTVHKKESKLFYSNYRLISLLSNTDKIIEKVCIIESINVLIKTTLSIPFSLAFSCIIKLRMLC